MTEPITSTPVVTKPPVTTITSTVEKDYTWVKAHIAALLVTVALLGATAVGSVYGVESLIAKHDLASEQRFNTQLAGEVANTKTAQDALSSAIVNFTAQVQALQAQNISLAQSIAARNTQTQKQVKIDATLDSQDAAQRLATQTSAQKGEVTVAPNGSDITISLPLTRTIIADMDSLQTSQQNFVDSQKELDNANQMYTASQTVNAAQTKTITALEAQNVGQVKACAAEVATVKAKARKSKIKWFFIGYLVGKFTPPFIPIK